MQKFVYKKSCFISAVGVGLMLFGIFELFLLALYQHYTCESPLGCVLRKSDFMRLNLQNILIFTTFGTIFTGILTELRGVFLLSKMARDMRIFYDKLNLYFAASLFFALTLKDIMASSDYFFLIRIDVSRINYDYVMGFTSEIARGFASITAFICVASFLYKNSVNLSRIFSAALFQNRLARRYFYIAFSILVFVSGFYALESFSIIIFVPYLLSLLTAYYKISKTDEVKKAVVSEITNRVSRRTHAAIVILGVVMFIIVFNVRNVVSFMLGMFLFPSMIIILPLSVLFILQSYDLIKTVICAAIIETIVFWAFLFTPFYAALFVR